MYQTAPGKHYEEPEILVKGNRLKVVDTFVYLGGTVSRTGSLDNEISSRIQSAASSFGNLEDRVWSQHNIKSDTKVKVYSAFVLSSLLYTCETWTTYARHLKSLERFHQKCLRHILHITWQSLTPDTEVLSRSGIPSVESLIFYIVSDGLVTWFAWMTSEFPRKSSSDSSKVAPERLGSQKNVSKIH